MFASLTVLPAMLSWLGDRVEKGRVPFGRRRGPAASRASGPRSTRVMRRPVVAIVLAGGLLVALAIPALGMKSVTSGIEELPQDLAVIQTLRQGQGGVPHGGRYRDVVVEADDVRAAPTAGASRRWRKPGSDSSYRAAVTYSPDGTVAEIDVPTPGQR